MQLACTRDERAPLTAGDHRPTVESLYDRYAEYVYWSLCRLGVAKTMLADALQDVFVVVHRRLEEAPDEPYLRGWLFAIALRVASNHRRSARRRWWERRGKTNAHDFEDHAGPRQQEPLERTEHRQRIELFYTLLESLDDDKRAVFILAELEQMSTSEIARVLSINVNTAQARLRSARQRFEHALARMRASERRSVG